jgi:hypothetical protein
MIIKLDNQYIVEVFEILCELPFEHSTMIDTEPLTKRHPGIEQMIEQIAEVLNG